MSINNANDLINIFNMKKELEYERITPLKDALGFSVQRKYPSKIRYTPPKTKRGDVDVVSIIKIIYEIEKENEKNKVPLRISIGTFSRYLSKYRRFNLDNENCPTEESLKIAESSPHPLELIFIDNWFYDPQKKQFEDQKGEKKDPLKILSEVFKKHCDTTKRIKRFRYYFKFKPNQFLIKIYNVIIKIIKWLLEKLFGRVLEGVGPKIYGLNGYSNMKRLKTENIEIHKYKLSKNLFILFCSLIVIIYFIKHLFGFKWNYLNKIFENYFLVSIHIFLFFWILDVVVPKILFIFINVLIKKRNTVIYKTFKKSLIYWQKDD